MSYLQCDYVPLSSFQSSNFLGDLNGFALFPLLPSEMKEAFFGISSTSVQYS